MPRATDFDFAYTRANVIDGKFTYSSASERTRYTRALISYDNQLNHYDTDVTAVTDAKLQRRYGDNPLEVVSVARPEPGVFEISAVQYDPSKFAHIDTGARLEERPISVVPITVVPTPASVTLTSSYAVNQGIAISAMNISWPAVTGAVAYDVEWRTSSTSVDVTGIYSGAYLARVRSVSAFEISRSGRTPT